MDFIDFNIPCEYLWKVCDHNTVHMQNSCCLSHEHLIRCGCHHIPTMRLCCCSTNQVQQSNSNKSKRSYLENEFRQGDVNCFSKARARKQSLEKYDLKNKQDQQFSLKLDQREERENPRKFDYKLNANPAETKTNPIKTRQRPKFNFNQLLKYYVPGNEVKFYNILIEKARLYLQTSLSENDRRRIESIYFTALELLAKAKHSSPSVAMSELGQFNQKICSALAKDFLQNEVQVDRNTNIIQYDKSSSESFDIYSSLESNLERDLSLANNERETTVNPLPESLLFIQYLKLRKRELAISELKKNIRNTLLLTSAEDVEAKKRRKLVKSYFEMIEILSHIKSQKREIKGRLMRLSDLQSEVNESSVSEKPESSTCSVDGFSEQDEYYIIPKKKLRNRQDMNRGYSRKGYKKENRDEITPMMEDQYYNIHDKNVSEKMQKTTVTHAFDAETRRKIYKKQQPAEKNQSNSFLKKNIEDTNEYDNPMETSKETSCSNFTVLYHGNGRDIITHQIPSLKSNSSSLIDISSVGSHENNDTSKKTELKLAGIPSDQQHHGLPLQRKKAASVTSDTTSIYGDEEFLEKQNHLVNSSVSSCNSPLLLQDGKDFCDSGVLEDFSHTVTSKESEDFNFLNSENNLLKKFTSTPSKSRGIDLKSHDLTTNFRIDCQIAYAEEIVESQPEKTDNLTMMQNESSLEICETEDECIETKILNDLDIQHFEELGSPDLFEDLREVIFESSIYEEKQIENEMIDITSLEVSNLDNKDNITVETFWRENEQQCQFQEDETNFSDFEMLEEEKLFDINTRKNKNIAQVDSKYDLVSFADSLPDLSFTPSSLQDSIDVKSSAFDDVLYKEFKFIFSIQKDLTNIPYTVNDDRALEKSSPSSQIKSSSSQSKTRSYFKKIEYFENEDSFDNDKIQNIQVIAKDLMVRAVSVLNIKESTFERRKNDESVSDKRPVTVLSALIDDHYKLFLYIYTAKPSEKESNCRDITIKDNNSNSMSRLENNTNKRSETNVISIREYPDDVRDFPKGYGIEYRGAGENSRTYKEDIVEPFKELHTNKRRSIVKSAIQSNCETEIATSNIVTSEAKGGNETGKNAERFSRSLLFFPFDNQNQTDKNMDSENAEFINGDFPEITKDAAQVVNNNNNEEHVSRDRSNNNSKITSFENSYQQSKHHFFENLSNSIENNNEDGESNSILENIKFFVTSEENLQLPNKVHSKDGFDIDSAATFNKHNIRKFILFDKKDKIKRGILVDDGTLDSSSNDGELDFLSTIPEDEHLLYVNPKQIDNNNSHDHSYLTGNDSSQNDKIKNDDVDNERRQILDIAENIHDIIHSIMDITFDLEENDVMNNEVVKNDVLENDVVNNGVVENDVVNNDVVNNDVVNNDVVKNDVLENDVVDNGVVENDVVENDVVENDVVENDVVENDVVENDVVNNDVVKNELHPINVVRIEEHSQITELNEENINTEKNKKNNNSEQNGGNFEASTLSEKREVKTKRKRLRKKSSKQEKKITNGDNKSRDMLENNDKYNNITIPDVNKNVKETTMRDRIIDEFDDEKDVYKDEEEDVFSNSDSLEPINTEHFTYKIIEEENFFAGEEASGYEFEKNKKMYDVGSSVIDALPDISSIYTGLYNAFNTRNPLNENTKGDNQTDGFFHSIIPYSSYDCDEPPLIMDNGSGFIKVGLATDEYPLVIPAVVGIPNYQKCMPVENDKHLRFGNDAIGNRGILKLSYPVTRGNISNWDYMEQIWRHVFLDEVRVDTCDHPMVVVESAFCPKNTRVTTMELMMETYEVPAYYAAQQATMVLYSVGVTTGCVLNSGESITEITPVYDGYTLPHAARKLNIGGRDITEYLATLLSQLGSSFKTSAEFDICREIKEKHCFIKNTNAEELTMEDIEYRLPDGNTISLDAQRCCSCTEILFEPSLIGSDSEGIHQMLYKSITSTDIDLRKELFHNVVLAGGTANLDGMSERLQEELQSQANNNMRSSVRVQTAPNKQFATWQGAKILSNMSNLPEIMISKDEYHEYGSDILFRKCF